MLKWLGYTTEKHKHGLSTITNLCNMATWSNDTYVYSYLENLPNVFWFLVKHEMDYPTHFLDLLAFGPRECNVLIDALTNPGKGWNLKWNSLYSQMLIIITLWKKYWHVWLSYFILLSIKYVPVRCYVWADIGYFITLETNTHIGWGIVFIIIIQLF